MHRLSLEGVGICANFVFTGAQAVLAAKAGASIVRVSLQDLDEHGRPSADAVNEIRALLEASHCECDVMVATPENSTQFTECITAGAQIVSIGPPASSPSSPPDRRGDRSVPQRTLTKTTVNFMKRLLLAGAILPPPADVHSAAAQASRSLDRQRPDQLTARTAITAAVERVAQVS